MGSGQVSLLLNVEPQFIVIVTQMSRIGKLLTPMKAIALFNDMIDKTGFQVQQKEQKLKHTKGKKGIELGSVGCKYWLGLKKRNSDKIVTKKGEKYELDWPKWTTYHNFHQMYKRFGEDMEYDQVAEELAQPVWMNCTGDVVENESDVLRYKVTHNMNKPGMILCMYKVGSDTCQKGDGAVG